MAANAADTTSGTDGLLSGTQVVAPINIPINLGATSLGLLGDSAASVNGAGTPGTTSAPAPASISGSDGILSGTQIVAPITVPVSLGATSLGLIGDSAASVEGPGSVGTGPAPASAPAPAASTSGAGGVLSGTQIVAPITVPISLGSTSVGVTGGTTATVVTPPMVTPPAVTTPGTALPAAQPSASSTEVAAAAADAAPMSAGYSSAPKVLANTGVNTGMLLVGLLLLAFGGLLTLVLRRKRG